MKIASYCRVGTYEQLGVRSYDNAQQIEDLQKILYEISPELKLCGFTLDGNRATTAGISIPEKGNKDIIDKLLSMGFKKKRKSKKTERPWDAFSPYYFIVWLEKIL